LQQTNKKMSDDISQSVSQGGYVAYDEENRRIQEVSNELQRLCRLYETEPRDGKGYGSRFKIEEFPYSCFYFLSLPFIRLF